MPVTLINGRGQLGRELKKRISHPSISSNKKEVIIYHTWNIDNKSEQTQAKEYDKLVECVDNNLDKRFMFISTYSQKNNYYNFYKHKAESYVILNCIDPLVIRLPTLIGKGIIRDFINDTSSPYGTMNLLTKSRAAIEILNLVYKSNLAKSLTITGETISAYLVKSLIDEVKNEESIH
jgi:hypothetical protein